ncbi:MAG: lantibiotic dehydratase [Candidatus Eisenbacteria bacterium]|uniref:Lantibiotic dehydratase n=1 Tax=Eiseniibacteriota bacterium TaxID=2212470 RepID=A0A956NBZ4_UNCEI|nr:lantibiotic dehydratase [Candidatus Eisenbacteria bacterium]
MNSAAWETDCSTARERLRAWVARPDVREALFLASPSLEERIEHWIDSPTSENGLRIEVALTKYLYRMASRCTPFGLFAGNGVGRIGGFTHLSLSEPEARIRQTRLDMGYLDAVAERMVDDPVLRPHLPFRTNSSLYEIAGTYRYAEPRRSRGKRAYFLVDVEAHEHLQRIVERGRESSNLDALAQAAVDENVSFEEARDFVEELVDAKILVPSFGPIVTGSEAADDLIRKLDGIEATKEVRETLDRIRSTLLEMDARGAGIRPEEYHGLREIAETLAPVELSRLVQVDLVQPGREFTVSQRLVDELTEAVQVLLDLFGHGHQDPLSEFRRSFEERYGEADVRLVEALDEEIGIGFQTSHGPGSDASPLIAGLPFPAALEDELLPWGSRARYLEWKVAAAVANGDDEVVLEPREIAQFHVANGPSLAPAHHIHATILEDSRDSERSSATQSGADRDTARVAILEAAGGPSGARFLGRFCQADPKLREFVETHLRAEESLEPEVRYFEIVHLPEGRIGNILARPVLRDLEVEYSGISGAERDHVLTADDLWIGLRNGRIVLWSKSLGSEVRPRLTSAHNAVWNSLGLYRFLVTLQAQGDIEGVMWNWGPLESRPHLPRVRYKRIVLSRAAWNIPKQEIEAFRGHTGHAAFLAAQKWRERRRLPRWVGLVDQDNVLTIDLDHPLSVATLLGELRTREQAILHEVFPGARTDVIDGPDGRHTNEILLPLVRMPRGDRERPHTPQPTAPQSHVPPPHGPRPHGPRDHIPSVFVPGSEWLTIKLYAGTSGVDTVLTDLVLPLASEFQERGSIDRWFFLRYQDPDWHLRVRFHGDPTVLLGELLPALHEAADPHLGSRRIHRIQLDTYSRETFRYGGEGAIEFAEEIFHRDSEVTAAFLELVPGDEGLTLRGQFALVSMDRLLSDLGFDLAASQTLTDRLAEMFGNEFQIDGAFRKALRDRYRSERSLVEDVLGERGNAAEALGPAYDLLRARSAATEEPIRAIHELAAQGRLTEPIEEITGSLLHMLANRVLRSSQRAQELVLYRFLEKTYASQLARGRKDPGSRGTSV